VYSAVSVTSKLYGQFFDNLASFFQKVNSVVALLRVLPIDNVQVYISQDGMYILVQLVSLSQAY